MIGVAAGNVVMIGEMTEASADGAPKVYTRADWGAVPPRRSPRLLDRPPDHIIVHHTASPNTEDLSRGHAFSLSRQIQRFHMETQGWDDIGEQLTISRGGIVMEGRAGTLPAIQAGGMVVGAQSLHHNDHTFGIESEGTYVDEQVPGRLWAALVEVCTWLCGTYQLDPAEAIIGHRDYNQTECPGDALYRRLPSLRRTVARALGDDGGRDGAREGARDGDRDGRDEGRGGGRDGERERGHGAGPEKGHDGARDAARDPARDKAPDKVPVKALDRTRERLRDKAPDRTRDKARDKAPEKAPAKSSDKTRDKTREKALDKARDGTRGKTRGKALDKARDRAPDSGRGAGPEKGPGGARGKGHDVGRERSGGHGDPPGDRHGAEPASDERRALTVRHGRPASEGKKKHADPAHPRGDEGHRHRRSGRSR